MILGVVSDTHNRVDHIKKIVNIFNSNGVDYVIHTGDITQAKTLDRFSRLSCPLIGVYGNNDLEEKGLKDTAKQNGFNFRHPPFLIKVSNKKIAIFHEPDSIEEFLQKNKDIDLILHGHTHRYFNEKIKGTRVFNPGECAGMMKGKNAIGIVEFPSLKINRIFFYLFF